MPQRLWIKMKADIVIIGCGGAGLPAALTASEKGISDLVLAKRWIEVENAANYIKVQ